ncbi:sugar phosphate isomerase/epimerase family protein [Amycolatopsis magusensis]|uniref:Sugar phosphate isomerase/epimerase n=1 Tax=Amycolatopsis magusensis TaxID=882444 RepID=A0ABS4PM59_9PSEU|nr:sugar phosphate isomerase/epimerase [Amycolatopsis magusensis]MBP2180418.1 sugar phosphate isomerase/epimerase [Amycolatopsis magusensis]MDI5981006.1 sugar phosphate isomerase/epimerase [Amycolatopsis magusensis]
MSDRFLSRRSMLRGAAGAAVAGGALLALPGAASAGGGHGHGHGSIPLHRISVQLYTLRSLLEKDLEGTLSALSDIGYRNVEMAGTYGRSATEFRKLLDKHRLRATSSHIGIDGDVDKLIVDAKILGHRYSAVPWAKYETVAEWEAFAARLDKAAKAFAKAGIQFGYHNHDHEFALVEGKRPFDILAKGTNRHYCHFEVDLYWAVVAGVDPVKLFWDQRGRVLQYHVKDRGADGGWADVGTGNIPFKKIFDGTPGIREYIVEHDNPADPLKTAQVGFEYLRKVRF